MKRILAATAAALMSASVLAAPALAQSTAGEGGEAEVGVTQGEGLDLDTGSTAAIGGDMDGALSAIEGNSASAQAIMTMQDVSSVHVVRIGEIEGYDQAAIEDALGSNSTGASELQASIDANPVLLQHLQEQGVDASSVVAAQVEPDGAVTVYVR